MRMGRSKAVLPLAGGDTFVSRVVRTLWEGGVDDVLVVLGHKPELIESAVRRLDRPVRTVVNPDYEAGQLSSMNLGLSLVDRPGVVAALITLVDVPAVRPETVRAVLARYRETHASIVRPVNGARHGHPMVVDRSIFRLLRTADPLAGPKQVIREHSSTAGEVEVSDEGAFLDVDTPAEYERLLADWTPSFGWPADER
jgi:molybdenum cofactor cytidylyltransferase